MSEFVERIQRARGNTLPSAAYELLDAVQRGKVESIRDALKSTIAEKLETDAHIARLDAHDTEALVSLFHGFLELIVASAPVTAKDLHTRFEGCKKDMRHNFEMPASAEMIRSFEAVCDAIETDILTAEPNMQRGWRH